MKVSVEANPLRRTLSALSRWPSLADWLNALPVLLVAGGFTLALAWTGDFASWSPQPFDRHWLLAAAILFFVPALFEEVLFRGLLLPVPGIASPRVGMWLSVALFVLWHPLQALVFGPPWADMFLHPAFLAAVFILGMALVHVRLVTNSLWPAIFGHWIIVAAWKLLFGGPF